MPPEPAEAAEALEQRSPGRRVAFWLNAVQWEQLRGDTAGPPRGDTAVLPRGEMAGPPRGEMAVLPRGEMAVLPRGDTAGQPRSTAAVAHGSGPTPAAEDPGSFGDPRDLVEAAALLLAAEEVRVDVLLSSLDHPDVLTAVVAAGDAAVRLDAMSCAGGAGVRLVALPRELLVSELAQLPGAFESERCEAVEHPARHAARYPQEMLVAGLAAVERGAAVLAELAGEIARAGPGMGECADSVARQLTHLRRDWRGALVVTATSGGGAPARMAWTRTTSGWFALDPVRVGGDPMVDVRPRDIGDLASALALLLASVQAPRRRSR